MFRQVFVRGNGIISNYSTTDSLSPNTWTYLLMNPNKHYISVNGVMQLVLNPPPPTYTESPKQTIKKSQTIRNISLA